MIIAAVLARMDLVALLDDVAALAVEAGHATLPFYEGDDGATSKADGSPVTLADHAAEAIILPGLARLTPAIPAVSEEAAERGRSRPWPRASPSGWWTPWTAPRNSSSAMASSR
ncbi:hypothetical protein [Nitrospirillum sp. BR 11828]|uniref:hypothetical protein n=1 Tax=Nitrospirillum sp. BR 11828 TaxID=3104325 RepID=UPI002ACAB0E6|nr:hypothetical protein [Nitrospirillum sp. BR 11828]MDZ5649722.1 hypothetical protein [Nitrospirillum sp. BR 11828]